MRFTFYTFADITIVLIFTYLISRMDVMEKFNSPQK